MRALLRQKAIDFRVKKQLSYSEIRRRLKVPKSTLSYWLQEYPLSKDKILELRRKGWRKGEASREKYRATMRQKKEFLDQTVYAERYQYLRDNLTSSVYYVAGLMLYLAEGAKRKSSTIVLANTDPSVINFFIRWMKEYLAIDPSSVRVQLHLYENMDLNSELIYWKRQLAIEKTQFYKISVRKIRGSSFSYKSTHRHGTCSLYAFGVDKVRELMMAVRAFVDIYLEKR